MTRYFAFIVLLAAGLPQSKCYSQSFDLTLEVEREFEGKNKDADASERWWRGTRQFGRAILYANELVRESYTYYSVRANLWMEVGEYDRAIDDYTSEIKAIERTASGNRLENVNFVRQKRGRAYAAKGHYELAIADFRAAGSERDLAWVMATCPDPKFRDGKAAVNLLNGKGKGYYDVMAASFAEAGDFLNAIRFQELAIAAIMYKKAEDVSMCLSNDVHFKHGGDYLIGTWTAIMDYDKEKEEHAARLALFRQGNPFRDVRPTNYLEALKKESELRQFVTEHANKVVSDDKLNATIALANETVKLAPNRGGPYFLRARLRRMSRKRSDLVIRDCTHAIRFLYTREEIGKCLSLRGDAWESVGDYKRALADYQLAIKLSPNDKTIAGAPDALDFLHLPEMHQIRKEAEVEAKSDAIDPKSTPNPSEYCAERGWAALAKDDFISAIRHATKAINYDETNEKAYYLRAQAWHSRGFLEAAVKDLDQAIRIAPKYKEAYVARGICWSEMRQLDKAIADYNEAIQQDEKHEAAYLWRSTGWYRLEAYSDALHDLSALIHINPEHSEAHISRAWIQATCTSPSHRNGEQAVADATRACELTAWKEARYLDILAAAYAEAGEFAKAVQFGEQAVAIGDEKVLDKCREHLALYRDGKPVRFNRPWRAK